MEKTAKRLGYKNASELLAAVNAPTWEAEPKPTNPVKRTRVQTAKRRANLTADEKKAIKSAYKNRKEGETASSIAVKFGIAVPTLFRLMNPLKK